MLSLFIPEKNSVQLIYESGGSSQSVTFSGKAYQIWPNPQTNACSPTTVVLDKLFSVLSENAQRDLFKFYQIAHTSMRLIRRDNIYNVVSDIAVAWANVYLTHDIVSVAMDMASSIHVPEDIDIVGDRPQDTDALTYKEADYRGIYVMSILGMLMTPIWTELLNHFSFVWSGVSTQDMQGERELAVFAILEPTFNDPRIEHAYDKLCNYTQHSIARQHDTLNKTGSSVVPLTTFTNSMTNTSDEKFVELCFANLLVKSLIRFPFDFMEDTNKSTSNIMRKVHSQILSFVQQRSNLQRNEYRAREPQKLVGTADSTQRQQSACEVATVPLSGLGTQAMLGPAFNLLVQRACQQYNISMHDVQQLREFYQEHPFPRTPFNMYVTSSGWRNVLPPKVINDLANSDYHTLVGITQLIMATTMNYGNQLIFMLSATQDGVRLEGMKHPWYEAIRISLVSSTAVEEFKSITRFVANRDSCVDNQIRNILDQVCATNNFYNVPPLLDGLDSSACNGDLVVVNGEFLNQTMKLGVRLITQELIECPRVPMATIYN